MSRRDIAGFELSLRDEFDVFLNILELAVEVVEQQAELRVARFPSSVVEGFYVLFADLDELLVHLVVFLCNEFDDAHGSAHFLADLVEVLALAGCLDVSGLDVLFGELSGLEGVFDVFN